MFLCSRDQQRETFLGLQETHTPNCFGDVPPGMPNANGSVSVPLYSQILYFVSQLQTAITSAPKNANTAFTNDFRNPQKRPASPVTRYSFIAPGFFQYRKPLRSLSLVFSRVSAYYKCGRIITHGPPPRSRITARMSNPIIVTILKPGEPVSSLQTYKPTVTGDSLANMNSASPYPPTTKLLRATMTIRITAIHTPTCIVLSQYPITT